MSSAARPSRSFDLPADSRLGRLQQPALFAGVGALALAALGGLLNADQFFRSYLIAYVFWFGIAMGSMAILMIHHVAGGAWGAVIRRILESSTRTFPVLAALFVPVLFGLSHLYEWAHPEEVAHDPILQHKALFLNVPFFIARAVIYFAVWLLLARYLNRWSLEQDTNRSPAVVRRLELLSRAGLVTMMLTMTFASIDWLMSLEPHWFSTLYGVLVMGGQLVVALAFTVRVAAALTSDDGPLTGVVRAGQFHDLGKFMLAFTMLWGYFSLSQLLIIWSANLPEETPWYLNRMAGGWQGVGIVIILFYFFLPFFLLLSRDRKRDPVRLARVALLLLVVGFVHAFWLISPAFRPKTFSLHWMDLLAVIGVGGIWLWAFISQLKGRSLVAINDPSLPELA